MTDSSERLRFFAYRCHRCGRLLTRLGILAVWVEAEKNPNRTSSMGLCPCGSRHVSPSNVKWYEELFYPRVWKLWALEIFIPWLKRKFGNG